jgi:hypothetical protein
MVELDLDILLLKFVGWADAATSSSLSIMREHISMMRYVPQ